MIILAPEDEHQVKTDHAPRPTVRCPEPAVAAGRSSTPSTLPDYETSQAQQLLDHHLHPTRRRRRGCRWPQASLKPRSYRALLYGLALYVFLTIVVGVPLIVTQLRRPYPRHYSPPPWEDSEETETSSLLDLARIGLVMVGDTGGFICNNWTMSEDVDSGRYRASVSHTFSPSGSLSISSNASEANFVGMTGALWADVNPDTSVTDIMLTVDVVASSDMLRHMVHVCFGDAGNDRGAAIYVPSHLPAADTVDVQIYLLYPSSPSLDTRNLVTSLPLYTQAFDSLSPTVVFDTLSVYGSRGDIWCDSVQARKIVIQNSLGSIGGNFNATQLLKLDTIEAPIKGNITLTYVDSDDAGTTTLAMYTGNSEVNANVTLYTNAVSDLPPEYMLDVKTFNDTLSLDVAYDTPTPDARVNVHAQNNLAQSIISMDEQFTGTFDLQTKLSSAEVWEGDTSSPDAYRGSDHRSFIYDTRSATRRKGWVGWGSRPEKWQPNQGHIDVVSSYSPVYLRSRSRSGGP
ncbi:hypothetical protein HDZ31DRAFT_39983 [Schizophyllum fasciatum]